MIPALSPEVVMAGAILSAKRANAPILIEDVSGAFEKLRQQKIDSVGKVALKRLPRGLYSEDVEAFFGRLLAGGFAKARSPLEVNEDGLQLCQELLTDEFQSHPREIQKVAQVLGWDLDFIGNPVIEQTHP